MHYFQNAKGSLSKIVQIILINFVETVLSKVELSLLFFLIMSHVGGNNYPIDSMPISPFIYVLLSHCCVFVSIVAMVCVCSCCASKLFALCLCGQVERCHGTTSTFGVAMQC